MRVRILLTATALCLSTGCVSLIRDAVAGAKTDCLVLVGSTTRETDGINLIVGSVRNGCERTFSSVTVVFKLDRRDNSTLPQGLAMGYLRDLKAGEMKDFESAMPVGRDATYRLDQITAF